MLWDDGREIMFIVADTNRWSPPMQTPNDLNQSRIVLKQDSTLIAMIEMSCRAGSLPASCLAWSASR
jgi:hypothetical protein